jgi:hypothetical protein
MLPFVLPVLFDFKRLRELISVGNVCGVGLFAIFGLFYVTKLDALLPLLDVGIRSEWLLASASTEERIKWLLVIIFFVWWIEFGLYAVFVFLSNDFVTRLERQVFILSLILLAALPFYIYGQNSDLSMSASLPAIFLLSVLTIRSLHDLRPRRALWWGLVALYFVGALNPVQQVAAQIASMVEHGWIHMREYERFPNLVTMYQGQATYARQYFSRTDGAFFTHLSRPLLVAGTGHTSPQYLFGNSIVLDSFSVSPRVVLPGEATQVIQAFRTVQSKLEVNYSLSTRLVGPDGSVIARSDGWPVDSPTIEWKPPRLKHDSRMLRVPMDAPPGLYHVEVDITDPRGDSKVPIYKLPSGLAVGDFLPLDYVIVGSATLTPTTSTFRPVTFGQEIVLMGSDLPGRAWAGETLPVHLYWRTERSPERQYTAFVQVLDAVGNLVAQHDQPLMGGAVPTQLWKAGEQLPDLYSIELPTELAPGEYTVIAGLYDGATGIRLATDDSRHPDFAEMGRMTIFPPRSESDSGS